MEPEFLGIKLFDEDFFELFIRGTFSFAMNYLIVRYCYLQKRKFNSHVFSFYIFSTVIFFICYLMSNVKLDFGVAFGLFAIFSILRYRTNPIPIREMTYLFIVMGVAVINALSNKKVSYAELIFTNFAIFGFTWALERYGHFAELAEKSQAAKLEEANPKFRKRELLYTKLDHLKPENHSLLLADLESLTGLEIARFEIQKTDYLNQTAQIKIFYQDKPISG